MPIAFSICVAVGWPTVTSSVSIADIATTVAWTTAKAYTAAVTTTYTVSICFSITFPVTEVQFPFGESAELLSSS